MQDKKQAKMVTAILQGKPDYIAYKEGMGCSIETAKTNAATYLAAHPEVKRKCIAIIEKREDLSREKALDRISAGLTATNASRYGVKQEWQAQTENVKLLLRLYGELDGNDTKTSTLTQINQYNIVNDIGIDKLKELIAEVKHMRQYRDYICDGEIVQEQGKT
jgi:hypothetical protein